MSNQDLKPMDLSLLERVNPIYNTAKMSLCGLAMSGDRGCRRHFREAWAARANQSYIGLDLPATISEAERVIMPLVDEDKRPLT